MATNGQFDTLVEERAPSVGREMHQLCQSLFPICRSITGNGVRQTLDALRSYLSLQIHEVPSGSAAFDWIVPKEWNIQDAFVEDERGNRVIDFRRNNLHVVGYSTPVDRWVTLNELQEHLHSLEDQPDAVPYITSYYKERWGFCIAHRERLTLSEGRYRVVIDSDLKDGHLSYGECLIPRKNSEGGVPINVYLPSIDGE